MLTQALPEGELELKWSMNDAKKNPSRTYHLHGRVNERHSDVWRFQVNVIPGAKRDTVPVVSGLHQDAEAGR